MVRVSIVIGSESDRDLGEKAEAVLDEFGVENELVVYSAHRSPGLSAALPGFIAAHTLKPVIGVPKDVKLGGLDSLLSIVQMPPGVPVACVGIDNAQNAALLGIEILALGDDGLREKLAEYRRSRAAKTSSPRT
jgi:5-(carboxyamino)imidazole ribonucleotide mutase